MTQSVDQAVGTSQRPAVDLGPVQETLLIPLYGRALETRKPNGLLHDPKAVQIVDALDYDFNKWPANGSPLGACLRTTMFDQDVAAFLGENPSGTVVEIGCGLNTRFERLDNGQATWIELDLPDSMALRRQFFTDQPRRRMLSASVLDSGWMDEVERTGGPYCFVSEAVLFYLPGAQVAAVLRTLARRFPRAWLLMDTASTLMLESQQSHDAMKSLSKDAWFRWACDDPSSLGPWGARLVQTRDFLDASPELRRRLPFSYRLGMTLFPSVLKKKMQGYCLNRFRLEPAPEPSDGEQT